MQRQERITLLQKLEEERKSKVIVYITSDRQPPQLCSASIALDVLPLFYSQLKVMGKAKKISLCIKSAGGNLDTPWPLVNLIREYCDELEVIVLDKALSAATLLALGANKIIMGPFSQLSPVDPLGEYVTKDGKKITLEVEDIIGFISLAKEKIGIKEQSALSEILKSLVGDVPTYILGSVNRTHSLIRRISENLLRLHLKGKNKGKQVRSIVTHLTERLYFHNHFVNRKEAKEIIGFAEMIEYASKDLEDLINDITILYNDTLEITKPFEPLKILGEKDKIDYISRRALIESTNKTNIFESHLQMVKIPVQPLPQVSMNITYQGWLERGDGQ